MCGLSYHILLTVHNPGPTTSPVYRFVNAEYLVATLFWHTAFGLEYEIEKLLLIVFLGFV